MQHIEITTTQYQGMDKNEWYDRLYMLGYAIVVESTDTEPRYWLNIPDGAGWDFLLKLREDLDNEIILTDNLSHEPVIEIYDSWRE